ncbi:hypothetical protein AJ80_09070 [Polytolypa hystricis UAMH7299]|uniref:NADH dehydrogenase [ubiquinone] 1 alpha subcomplex assembly factor 3 n=1 Tax=Polytolypa hystricis (strain UAMH7299) TaxID=1447883 RepID=A0A2B7WWZ2_POLH7|nr:hypothetical protein AJ80_09070 [Polytolypa hystricis UAMH7299]
MHAPSARLLRALHSSSAASSASRTSRCTPRLLLSRQNIWSGRHAAAAKTLNHTSSVRSFSTTTTTSNSNNDNSNDKNTYKPPSTLGLGATRSRRLGAQRRDAPSPPPPGRTRTRNTTPENEGETDAAASGTNIDALNVLGDIAAPTTSIDACLDDGFHLNNGMKVTGGSGCLLLDGEVFSWRPWEQQQQQQQGTTTTPTTTSSLQSAMVNPKGQFSLPPSSWGVLKLVYPKPDLLILGVGAIMRPLDPQTREDINKLGIRIEVADTRNAAAQFNLLATERGVREVVAALIPIGWKG